MKNVLFKGVFVMLVSLYLSGCGGGSGGGSGSGGDLTATLTWRAPTQNSDNSDLTNLAGFNIYYGSAADSLVNTINITDPTVTEYVVPNLGAGTVYYFAVTAVNRQNVESVPSAIVSKSL